MEEKEILIGASFYNLKHYINEEFNDLPDYIKKELEELIIVTSARTKGIVVLGFYADDGSIFIEESCEDDDILYDKISAGLEISRFERENKLLLDGLTKWYNQVYRSN